MRDSSHREVRHKTPGYKNAGHGVSRAVGDEGRGNVKRLWKSDVSEPKGSHVLTSLMTLIGRHDFAYL